MFASPDDVESLHISKHRRLLSEVAGDALDETFRLV